MAALGIRGLVLVFTAGYSGSYLYNNQQNARELAGRILNMSKPEPKSTQNGGDDLSTLSAQLSNLTQQISQPRPESVVILPSHAYKGSLSTLSDALNLLGWAVFSVTIGGLVYYIAIRKNIKLTDILWVSRATFNGTINSMQTGLSHVSETVSSVRKDLSQRLGLLKSQVDDVRDSLSNQIESEVKHVQGDIQGVGMEVSEVKSALGDVSSRIEELDSKIDYATNGIVALVKAVSSVAPERVGHGTPFYELKKFAERSGGRARRLSTGLRGLLGESEEAAGPGGNVVASTSIDGKKGGWPPT